MSDSITARPLIILISVLFSYFISAQQPDIQQCGSIGNGAPTADGEINVSTAHLFYLDIDNPATCTGNVTGWRVCYFGPENVTLVGSYLTSYAVFRRVENGSDSFYQMVSPTYAAVRVGPSPLLSTDSDFVDGRVETGGFNCYTDFITVGDSPIEIQEGDVIGACVIDPVDVPVPQLGITLERFPLDIVGEVADEAERLLSRDTTGCTADTFPDVVMSNELSPIASRRLFISTMINESVDTMIGPSIGADETTSGTVQELTTTDTTDGNIVEVSTTTGALIGIILAVALFAVFNACAVCAICIYLRQKSLKESQAHGRLQQRAPSRNLENTNVYESISSRVIRSLTRRIRRSGRGFGYTRSRVFSDSLLSNYAYIPAHRGNAYKDVNTIGLDVNPAYIANSDNLDSQGHFSTAYATSDDRDLSQCNESSDQNAVWIPTHS